MSRAFPTTAPNITSSDRSKILKQQTIYNNIRDNIQNNVCQKKANKFGSINYCLSTSKITDPKEPTNNYSFVTGKIRSTDGYETLYDFSKGKAYCNPCNILLNRFDGSNGESSNTLYTNPDDVIIADTAQNYCVEGGLPCCGGSSPTTIVTAPSGGTLTEFSSTNQGSTAPSGSQQSVGQTSNSQSSSDCNLCGKAGDMVYKVNNIGVFDVQNAIGFISKKCYACDRVCEPTNVIIDPSHNTFRTKCKSSFMGTDKPGPWINRIRTANPSVMTTFAKNSYQKKLAGFSLLNQININAYPKGTISVQNCSDYPQYNGIYLLDQDKYIVDITSSAITPANQPGSSDLVYSQWVQVDGGKLTGRTIIPCIGAGQNVAVGFPCIASYLISTTNLRSLNHPFPGGNPVTLGGTSGTWAQFTPYNTLYANMPPGTYPDFLPPSPDNEFYMTNVFQYDASGFRPTIIETPNTASENKKSDPAIRQSWNETGVSNFLVDQPIEETFSAQYPDYTYLNRIASKRVPINEDIITIKTIS